MTKSIISLPNYIKSVNIVSNCLPSAEYLKLDDAQYTSSQEGSRSAGLKFLNTFL